jgi:hypothetical protein
MKHHPCPSRNGFTLVELTVAISMGMAVSAIILVMFNQQLAFLRFYRDQTFLTEEAPLVSMHVSKLVGKAERFRLHANVVEARAGFAPSYSASPVLVLNFRQPNGTVRASILSYEDRGAGKALYYYLESPDGSLVTPQWYLTKMPKDVSFSVQQGILRMTLTGPNNEQVTYSGAMTQ